MDKKQTILVGGATGKQGGAVADLLIRQGYSVIAYVQPGNEHSEQAQALAARGATIAVGDLSDSAALTKAAQSADAIFSITVPFGPEGAAGEVAQGKALADAAAATDTRLIYSSIAGIFRKAEDDSVQHASSKAEIEHYIESKHIRATVIAPTYLMENLLNVDFVGLRRGVFAMPLSPNRKINETTVLDIAGMVLYALEHPEETVGKRIEIASENVSGAEIANVFSSILGKDIPYVQLPIEQIRERAGNEIATMFERFESNPYYIDIETLHQAYPDVAWHTFESWARTIDWNKLLA